MEIEKEIENIAKFPSYIEKNFKSLGTDISIRIVVQSEDERKRALLDLNFIPELYQKYTQIFSRFEKESELSRLNLNLGILQSASVEMREIVSYSLKYWEETGGFYDPRVIEILEDNGYNKDFNLGEFEKKENNLSSDEFGNLKKDLFLKNEMVFFGRRMDFSGIAKGFINDKIKDHLLSFGWKNFLADSGGDMYLSGLDEESHSWIIGVEGISDQQLMFSLSGSGIATSGISRRKWEVGEKKYHHLINPKNPHKFSFDLKSVTVIAQDTKQADIWAKVLFLMGKEEGTIFARENKLAAFFLAYRGGSYISPECRKFAYENNQ
jgi:thiamine biosynthesis lipoprotein